MSTYNKKTGVTTLLKLVKHLCGIYDTFAVPITNWVNSSSLTDAQKATINSWLTQASEVCVLIRLIPDD